VEFCIFVMSMIFLILVATIKKIPLLSPYSVFSLFQILYNLVPWSAAKVDAFANNLLGDRSLIAFQLLLAASANLAFGIAHLLFYRNVSFPRIANFHKERSKSFVFILSPLFFLTLFFVHIYGWNSLTAAYGTGKTTGGWLYGFTAYSKELMVAAYLFYLYKFGLDKWALVIFFENILIMIIDGARTTGLPLIILTFMIWNNQIELRKKKRVYLCLLLGLLATIGTRSLMVGGNSMIEKLVIPITVEGAMGSYSSLQSIYAIQHQSGIELPYTFGGSYVLDPIAWLPSQGGQPRANPSFFDNWVNKISELLPDDFAPMGGFYFISEAVAGFSYAGPFLIAGGYALLLILMERNKRRWYCAYLAFTPTIGLLFVKMIFGNVFKLFIVQMIFLLVFIVGSRLKITVARIVKRDLMRQGY